MTGKSFKTAAIKAAIILVPCWTTAWLTDKMVYVVPMLAASAIFAATFDKSDVNRLVDEEAEDEIDIPDAG
ncbi:hypothetical protein [Yoonia sp. SS1-5]|uniref:Uncharacterized protein n=1 Tax=Yoonia rhodophyticola TaxID=3137370 RepID=A0AAN0M7K4_9RHOB